MRTSRDRPRASARRAAERVTHHDYTDYLPYLVANAEPFSDKPVGVEGDSEYVLEVNGGFCAKNAVKAGDRLDFSGFSTHASE